MKFLVKIEEGCGFISKNLHYMVFINYKIFHTKFIKVFKELYFKKFDS